MNNVHKHSAQRVILLIELLLSLPVEPAFPLVLLPEGSLRLSTQCIIHEITEDTETRHLCPGGGRRILVRAILQLEGLSLWVEGCHVGFLLSILVIETIWLELPPDDEKAETSEEEKVNKEEAAICLVQTLEFFKFFYLTSLTRNCLLI